MSQAIVAEVEAEKNVWNLIYFKVELAWFYDGLNVVWFFCNK